MCGYEVPRMILLRDLKRAMPFDRSKDMSVHVLTCAIYDFNVLTQLCASCSADKTCVSTTRGKNE